MITANYAFLPHIRVSVVIIFKSVGYKGCEMKKLFRILPLALVIAKRLNFDYII
ncbi:hypothetical protein [Symbiopectobacterium sp. RP]|uniref:hypothetical protein n=1 Tax=Symbiopectobacterium sp. RP TaxID=3248553 RepID=UPI003D26C0AD